MEELDEFYSKIQALLMKKNAEYGELKLLSSKVTQENAQQVDEICEDIKNIFTSSGIPVYKEENYSLTNEKCVGAFQYLIFNTHLECQDELAEDIVKGHLVDMCPPLSPFLLICILYHLHYDEILSEFLLHCPLELAVELNLNARRNTNIMTHKRALSLTIKILTNTYLKLLSMKDEKIHSLDIDSSLSNFVIGIQELILTLKTKKLFQLPMEEEEMKIPETERFGLMIKDLIKLIKCLKCDHEKAKINLDNKKIYEITFGRNSEVKCLDEYLQKQISCVNAEMLQLLTAVLQDVDINTYLDWASYNAPENKSMSLQQSIGVDCYNLANLISKFEDVKCSSMLLNCLQQLSSKPKVAMTSNLEELCRQVEAKDKAAVKKLMDQSEEWNSAVFECIKSNDSMLDSEDLCKILEYLVLTISKNDLDLETHIQEIYNTITKIFMSLSVADAYDVALTFILNNDARNILESSNTEEMFNHFIERKANLRNPMNLKIMLMFLMKSPEKFLTTLVKMCIGYPQYKNVMFPPEHLFLLSFLMKMKCKEETKFIIKILESIGLNDTQWEFKKYTRLIIEMIEADLFSADEISNFVFIPMLKAEHIPFRNIKSLLHTIIQLFSDFSDDWQMDRFLLALTDRLLMQRKNREFSKHLNDELITMTTKIVRSVLHHHKDWIEEAKNQLTVLEIIRRIHPIDQVSYAQLLNYKVNVNVTDIVTDYKRKINSALLLVDEHRIQANLLAKDVKLHLILTSTEKEFIRIASEMVVIHWDFFEENPEDSDENNAFIKFMGLMKTALKYCLELPDLTSPHLFANLIKSLVNFLKEILQLESKWDHKKMLSSIRENFQNLSDAIRGNGFENYYEEVMVYMNNVSSEQTCLESLLNVIAYIDNFGNMCLQTQMDLKAREQKPRVSEEIAKCLICQEIIGLCLEYKTEYSSIIVRSINRLHAVI